MKEMKIHAPKHPKWDIKHNSLQLTACGHELPSDYQSFYAKEVTCKLCKKFLDDCSITNQEQREEVKEFVREKLETCGIHAKITSFEEDYHKIVFETEDFRTIPMLHKRMYVSNSFSSIIEEGHGKHKFNIGIKANYETFNRGFDQCYMFNVTGIISDDKVHDLLATGDMISSRRQREYLIPEEKFNMIIDAISQEKIATFTMSKDAQVWGKLTDITGFAYLLAHHGEQVHEEPVLAEASRKCAKDWLDLSESQARGLFDPNQSKYSKKQLNYDNLTTTHAICVLRVIKDIPDICEEEIVHYWEFFADQK